MTEATTSTSPTPATDWPAVLIDYLCMRLAWALRLWLPRETGVTDLPGPQLAAFLTNLRRFGVADPVPDNFRASVFHRDVITFRLETPWGTVSIRAELHCTFTLGKGWVLARSSKFIWNGMRYLRQQGYGTAAGLSLNGNDNWIGPRTHEWPALLVVQVKAFSWALAEVWRIIAASAGLSPQTSVPSVEVRDLEVCRDEVAEDAVAQALEMEATFPPGMTEQTRTHYGINKAARRTREGLGILLSRSVESPVFFLKIYAKTPGVLRLEGKYVEGDGVRELLGVRYLDPASIAECREAPVSELLERVARHAARDVDNLHGHLAAVLASYSSPFPLLSGFGPLWRLWSPDRQRTGPRLSAATYTIARNAFLDLVVKGIARPKSPNGKGLKEKHPVRRALDAMCREPNAVLRVEADHYERAYVLLPRFASARRLLQRAFVPALLDLFTGEVGPANDP